MEKASHKANVQCAEDIGKAINSYFDGFHYHTGFEKELIETYGMEQVKYVVAYNIQQKLIFPVVDCVLAILLFVKLAMAYFDYKKHGEFDFAPVAILFFGLVFAITAPTYIWNILGI